MRARTLLRFGAEVAFISLVAVVAHLADLSTAGIIIVMAVAWLLTAIAEGLVSRGWQGAATFVPPVRPFSGGLEHREPAPTWESSAAPPEEIAPAWLESAEVLGVHVSGFEPIVDEDDAEPAETEEPEAVAEPEVDAVAVAAAEEEVPAEAPADEEAPEAAGEVVPDEAGVEPEPKPKPWPPPDRRWPWRRPRGVEERDRGPAPERKEEQPELPLFEVSERPCRSCGQPISKERLRAIPNATQCIDCKRAGRPELADIPDFEALASEADAELHAPPHLELEPMAETHPEPEPASEPVAVEPEPEVEPERELGDDLEFAAVRVEQQPEPEPEPAVAPAALSASTREWNVWELERLARRLGGTEPARDEEWAFLLVYLREFANPEGALPADFDSLVRESFPELVAVAETT